MAKFEKIVNGDFNEIVSLLDQEIINSGVSMNLVDESCYSSGDFQMTVRVYDKYFGRTGNRASLSLAVAAHGNDVLITAIGAGGGRGVIFNYSWGVEEELVSIVQNTIETKFLL